MSDGPICGWCQEPAVTEVITRPGRKLRKTVPACDAHARGFEERGIMTVRLEVEEKMRRDRDGAQWREGHGQWR